MAKPELLFVKYDARTALESHERRLLEAIDTYSPDAILTANVDELCDYFEQEYRVAVPLLRENDIEVSQLDQQFDARRDPNRVVFDESRPVWISGTLFTFHVPYQGQRELFDLRASTFTMNPPRAVVTPTEVEFPYETTDTTDKAAMKAEFERELAKVREHLSWLARDFAPFNEALRERARTRIEQRRAKLVSDRGAVGSLGFKVRERADAPRTYSVPARRREATMLRPPRGRRAPLEPTLDDKVYERILEICASMAVVLEQSPSAFGHMREEDIRNHFLVQLNGQFEGTATGETFSAAGKTDILVKVEGKNVFIAECKFWDGPKSATAALDQLLSYATWRDTKLALFVFSRSRDFTDMLRRLDSAITTHPSVKRRLEYGQEAAFRYLLARPDDPERELTLTVRAFAVPTTKGSRGSAAKA